MMEVLLVKKEKGRVYRSEDMVQAITGRELSHDKSGAPLVNEGYISITDTKNYWACVLSSCPVGLDMEEENRTVKPAIVRRLHPEEKAYLAVLSEGSREWTCEFLSVWTRKEALSKLWGKGLGSDFSSFSVLSPLAGDTACTYICRSGLVVALAAKGKPAEIQLRRVNYAAPMEKSALDAAASILDMRGYAKGELGRKLKEQGYGEEEIAEALEKLESYGYVNDKALAEGYAEKFSAKGYASMRILQELVKKGIERPLAEEIAAAYREDDKSRAKEALGSFDPAEADEKERAKAGRKLAALGYPAGMIYSLLER